MRNHSDVTTETKNGRTGRTPVRWTATAAHYGLLLALALPFLPPAGAQAPASPHESPVFWVQCTAKNPHSLAPRHREAVVEALRTAAVESEVILCFDPEEGSTDPAFNGVCRENDDDGESHPALRWNASVSIESHFEKKVVLVTISLDIHAKKKQMKRADSWPKPNILITQTEIVSSEFSPSERDSMIPKAIYDLITGSPQIRTWFDDLRFYPKFLRVRPSGEFAPPRVSKFAAVAEEEAPADPLASVSEEQEQLWEEEKEAIVDLLIDDHPEEARDRAEALLAVEDLPEGLARRVEELLTKAENELAAATEPVAPAAPDEPEAPSEPQPAPKPLDVTFHVRYVDVGEGGFRKGWDGRLRVSARDIRFVPDKKELGSGWSVAWSSFKSAGPASGHWDVAYPLVIETTDGKKFYVTEVTKEGRYGKGERILQYIEKGRKGG